MPDICVDGTKLPAQEELDDAKAAFEADWGEVDKVLYGICREYPAHDDRGHLVAKLAIVGRTCSAGVERCVTPGPGQQGLMLVAEHVWEHGGEVDHIVAAVRQVTEPLTAAGALELVEQHGRFTQLLASMPECNRLPRSFASKYLHFHHPAVPIYDSYAALAIGAQVRWSRWKVPFALPPHGDEEYWTYCVRLFRLYDACRSHGLNVTVKGLDQYLWAVPL